MNVWMFRGYHRSVLADESAKLRNRYKPRHIFVQHMPRKAVDSGVVHNKDKH